MQDSARLAYERIKQSGEISRGQGLYLAVYIRAKELGVTLTQEEATQMVYDIFGVKMAPRNGRITELLSIGFLDNVGIVDRKTKYEWTGRFSPIPMEQKFVPCPHCSGIGKKQVMRPVNEEQRTF